MNWIKENEKILQSALNTALSLDSEVNDQNRYQLRKTTENILFSTFDLFSNSTEIPKLFQNPETALKLEKVIDVMYSGLHLILLSLEPDENVAAKIYRSALQYFSDEYNGKFTELLSSYFVQELNEQIEIHNNPFSFSQFPDPPISKINLTNVPASHDWWLARDRNISK